MVDSGEKYKEGCVIHWIVDLAGQTQTDDSLASSVSGYYF